MQKEQERKSEREREAKCPSERERNEREQGARAPKFVSACNLIICLVVLTILSCTFLQILTTDSCHFSISNNEKEKKLLLKNGKPICGLVMARVLCPRDLSVPFLMYRSGITGKMSIPVCSKCADTENIELCQHSVR